MRRTHSAKFALAAIIAGLVFLATSPAIRADEFYRGKNIRIIVGFAAGGGFDAYSRAIARHLGRFIPGNPSVSVENMTGAEIAGGCWAWESIKVTWRKALETKDVVVVLQAVPKPHPELSTVPLAINFAKTDKARKLIEAGVHDTQSFTRPYALPPGTPKERVQLLRSAFLATLKDREFLAEAEKTKLDVEGVSGEDVERIIGGLFKLEPALLATLKDILAKK